MRKLWLIPVLLIYLVGLVYVSLPTPEVVPLVDATRSDEPGDTWQNPEQSAYFTQLDRASALGFYQDTFSLEIFGFKLPSYRLNYRPEDTPTYVRAHIDSYFLEEIVHPFRESLFINGWTPQLSPTLAHLSPEARAKQTIIFKDVEYLSKITLRPYFSSVWVRIFVWTAIFPLAWLTLVSFITAIRHFFSSIKSSLLPLILGKYA